MQKKTGYWLGVLLLIADGLIFVILFSLGLFGRGPRAASMMANALIWGLCSVLIFLPCALLILRSKYLPEQKTPATLHQKHIHVSDPGGIHERLHFHLTFVFPDGSAMVFEVPQLVFDSLHESQTGILTYKAKGRTAFFIRFDR